MTSLFGRIQKSLAIGAITAALLVGCGGGGGGSDGGGGGKQPDGRGHYLDSGVVGLHYECGSQSGTTGDGGTFDLDANESCTFSLGNIPLRTQSGDKVFDGVYILEENTEAARLLQTMDLDGNASNGIVITQEELSCLDGYTSLDEVDLDAVYDCLDGNVSDYNGSKVTREEAGEHIEETLEANRPVATPASYDVAEDGSLEITLEGTDPHPEHETLLCQIVTEPKHGVLQGEGCERTYRPDANFNGEDRFEFNVTDRSFVSLPAEVNITVTPVNDDPVLLLQPIGDRTLDEDFGSREIELNATDVDGDDINYSVSVGSGSVLQASVSGGTLTLSSLSDANGETNVTVTANDGHGGSDSRTFRVTVTPVNDAPALQAIPDQRLVEDFGSAQIELNATDVDGDALGYSVDVTDGSVLQASVSGGTLTLRSLPDANGETNVTVTANDGHGGSDSRTFHVTVTPVNDAPVIQPIDDLVLSEDFGSSAVDLNVSDADSDEESLNYEISVDPEGIVTVERQGDKLILRSEANATGSASVTVKVSDGSESSTQSFQVTVNPVNDAPVLQPIQDQRFDEDFGSAQIELNATDVDGDTLSYSVDVTDGSVLQASVSGGILTLRSLPDANGESNVTVTVSDGSLSDSRTFHVTVTPVNDAPWAEDFSVRIETNSTGNVIDLSPHVGDPDGDGVQLNGFEHIPGLEQSNDLELTYDNDGAEGSFSFRYTVQDSNGAEANATVTLIVSQEPIIPEANDDSFTISEDNGTVSLDVMKNDANGSVISGAELLTEGAGTVEVAPDGKSLLYTAPENYSGTVEIRYTLRSSTGDEDNATVTVTVTSVNDAPVITISPAEETIDEPQSALDYSVNVTVEDVDGPAVTTRTSVLLDGQESDDVNASGLQDGKVTLHIAPYVNGTVVLTVTADDGTAQTESRFTLHITPVASAPQVDDQRTSLNMGEIMDFTPFVTPEGESYRFDILANSDPSIADVQTKDGGHTFQIEAHDNPGETIVRFRAVNEADESLSAEANLTIQVIDPNNRPPIAENSNEQVEVDQILTGQLNAYDNGGYVQSYRISRAPEHGTVRVDGNGYYVYEPADRYTGPDSFGFVAVDDGGLESEEANVTITVHPSEHQGYDTDRMTEIPISGEEFAAIDAAGVPIDQRFYGVDFDEEDGKVSVNFYWHVFRDDGTVYVQESDRNESLNYTVDESSHEVTIDFDGDLNPDMKWKYVGEVNATEWLSEHNLTLPGNPVIYKSAIMDLAEEYSFDDDPEPRDCNESGCFGSFDTLGDFFAAATYRSDADDVWKDLKEIWVYGYGFMLAPGSDYDDDNGTLVRVARYWDHSNNKGVAVVTLENAGTWEKREVDGTTTLFVKPTVYGLNEVRIFAEKDQGDGTKVYGGEYRPANRASMEYTFDETTAYMMANALMPREAKLEPRRDDDYFGQFNSFENLPTDSVRTNVDLYMVESDCRNREEDGCTDWQVQHESLRFDENGSMVYRSEDDGTEYFEYTTNGDIIDVGDPLDIDIKFVGQVDDVGEIAKLLEIDESALGSNPVLYKIAFVNREDKLWSWDDALKNDNDGAYATLDAFMEDFKRREINLGDVKESDGWTVRYSSTDESNESRGSLGIYDRSGQFQGYAGRWYLRTIDGEEAIVFKVDVERYTDFNAAAVDGECGDVVCKSDFEARDTGTLEYWIDESTKTSIEGYLNDNPQEYDMSDRKVKIDRAVEGVAIDEFRGKNLYQEELDENGTCEDRTIESAYVRVEADSDTVYDSEDDSSYGFESGDNIVMKVQGPEGEAIAYVKMSGTLDSGMTELRTHLVIPESAKAYSFYSYDLEDGRGEWEVRYDDYSRLFLESYLLNNPRACPSDEGSELQ